MKGSTLIACLLLVGLLAGGFATPAAAGHDKIETIAHHWTSGFDDSPGGGDVSGDVGYLEVEETGEFAVILTQEADKTGAHTLVVNETTGENVIVESGDDDVATAELVDDRVVVDAHNPGTVSIVVTVVGEAADEEYTVTAPVVVVDQITDEERYFEDLESAQVIVVLGAISLMLGLAVAGGGIFSWAIALVFGFVSMMWFVGMISILVILPAFFLGLVAVVWERWFV